MKPFPKLQQGVAMMLKSAVFLLMLAGSISQAATGETGMLAKVGDTEITTEDIRSSLQNLDPNDQAALNKNPALLSQVVRTILVQRLVLKEALAKHWDQQPAFLAQLERL